MAQGLDMKLWSNDKSPPLNTKNEYSLKRNRGVGSRRIFPPQFKLQVLDSYRNDVDCRGNQRATARKYNIHRRQIQKWLQCEQNLRTSVEESAKKNVPDSKMENSRKKSESENDKRDVTLNRNATTFTRLGDAGRLKGTNETSRQGLKQENKVFATAEIKVESQNLKRVAQKLYPSLLNMSCAANEKSPNNSALFDRQKYNFGNVSNKPSLSPTNDRDDRDDNFNEIIGADNKPLDLKTKIHSEILPKEFLDSKMYEPSHDDKFDKLRIEVGNNCQSQLTSSSGNIGGQKLSVSNAVLKCLVQKYNIGDIGGQELCSQNCKNVELLCSQSLNRAESSCLINVEVPKISNNVPYSPDSSAKKISDEFSNKTLKTTTPTENSKSDSGSSRFIMNSKLINQFDCSKSFSPKRKWIKESMRDMEDGEHVQQKSSLPIKQRVKMNIKSLPESSCYSEEKNKPNLLCSNFTIEKLCSTNSPKETENSDCYTWHSSCSFPVSDSSLSLPPPIILPNRIIPDLVSLHFNHDMYNDHQKSNCLNETSLTVPFKEEKVSDNEDMDIDILSTASPEKKSLDYSGYNFGKRRSFSVQFKLTVLDAFYNDKDCNKNQRATARKFNINRRQVQKWLSQENDLRSGGSLKNGKYLQRQRLGGGCTHCPQHCIGKKEENLYDKTIEVNVKHCSDQKCLSRRGRYDSDHTKTRLSNSIDYYNKMENFSYNYFTSENNVVYHDSILGWPHICSSALSVPNFQYLSTWHHSFDYCQENPKIY